MSEEGEGGGEGGVGGGGRGGGGGGGREGMGRREDGAGLPPAARSNEWSQAGLHTIAQRAEHDSENYTHSAATIAAQGNIRVVYNICFGFQD